MTLTEKLKKEVLEVARELEERRRVVRMEILGKINSALDDKENSEDSYDVPGVPEGELFTFTKVVQLIEMLEDAALKRGAGKEIILNAPPEIKGPPATCEALS